MCWKIEKERNLLIKQRKVFSSIFLIVRDYLFVTNLVGTLLNIEGKTKDTTNTWLDLQDLQIRKDLHLIEVGNQLVKPHASYTLTNNEQVKFCKFLKAVKFSDRFVSNISWCVNANEGKISSLKSTTFMLCYTGFYQSVFVHSYWEMCTPLLLNCVVIFMICVTRR